MRITSQAMFIYCTSSPIETEAEVVDFVEDTNEPYPVQAETPLIGPGLGRFCFMTCASGA